MFLFDKNGLLPSSSIALWACHVVVSMYVYFQRQSGFASKAGQKNFIFLISILKVHIGSNILFLCPLDEPNVLPSNLFPIQ